MADDTEPDRVDGPLRISDAWAIPPAELDWRFSRSSGPGGQGVNTTDSRAELGWSPLTSTSFAQLPPTLQDRLLERLAPRLVNGAVAIAASEYRAQLRNRQAAGWPSCSARRWLHHPGGAAPPSRPVARSNVGCRPRSLDPG